MPWMPNNWLKWSRSSTWNPLRERRPIPRGLFNYRGEPVPVIDLRELVQSEPCEQHMTTRILLVKYPLQNQEPKLLGLLAEQVTETVKHDENNFQHAGIRITDTPYLNEITQDQYGMIHFLEFEHLLPLEVQQLLFAPDAA